LSAESNELRRKLLDLEPSPLLNPYRIAIMLELYYAGALDFPQLRADLNVSDGGLARYLRPLIDSKLVEISHEIVDSRWRKTYVITSKGIAQLEELLSILSDINRELVSER
jgi:DNA-binding MarR family transcriptional regulator